MSALCRSCSQRRLLKLLPLRSTDQMILTGGVGKHHMLCVCVFKVRPSISGVQMEAWRAGVFLHTNGTPLISSAGRPAQPANQEAVRTGRETLLAAAAGSTRPGSTRPGSIRPGSTHPGSTRSASNRRFRLGAADRNLPGSGLRF